MLQTRIYIGLWGITLAILGGSLILNWLLYNRAMQYYAELNQTRLDPLGWRTNFSDTDPPEVVADELLQRVVFFGDSRAASWPTPQGEGYRFINRGIASQTSVQTRLRFDQHVRSQHPDIVILQVGINDLKTLALFPDRRDQIIADCQANIAQIVDESREMGATVILSTIFPAGKVPLERQPVWSEDINQAIIEVNTYIATLAGEEVLIFDAFSLLADNRGQVPSHYRLDELHLNPQGYEVLNRELLSLLNSLPRSSAPPPTPPLLGQQAP